MHALTTSASVFFIVGNADDVQKTNQCAHVGHFC